MIKISEARGSVAAKKAFRSHKDGLWITDLDHIGFQIDLGHLERSCLRKER